VWKTEDAAVQGLNPLVVSPTMSDSTNDDGTGSLTNYFLFFFLFIVVCICYCGRNEEPQDDPSNDRIAGWIPNSTRPTPSLEEKRQHIEDNLILKKVVAGPEPDSTRRPMLDRFAKSERTFSSYAAALKLMTTSKRKVTKFEPVLRHSQSLPSSFNWKDENEEEDDEDESENDDDAENPTIEHNEHNHAENCSIKKHRRKCDIVVRTLARTLSANQDYAQPTTCDICLLDYEVGEEVAWSTNEGCIHAFHKECIVDWLLRNPKCPLCRRDYVVEPQQAAA
jgi:hypothetical protein